MFPYATQASKRVSCVDRETADTLSHTRPDTVRYKIARRLSIFRLIILHVKRYTLTTHTHCPIFARSITFSAAAFSAAALASGSAFAFASAAALASAAACEMPPQVSHKATYGAVCWHFCQASQFPCSPTRYSDRQPVTQASEFPTFQQRNSSTHSRVN